jgi:hypothetical protein
MSLKNLTTDEIKVIGECIRASLNGPFFKSENLHTLFGLWDSEVEEIVRAWPNVVEDQENTQLAINNALNMLLMYPHRCWNVWSEYISVSPERLAEIYAKWLNRDELDTSSQGFFDRLR